MEHVVAVIQSIDRTVLQEMRHRHIARRGCHPVDRLDSLAGDVAPS